MLRANTARNRGAMITRAAAQTRIQSESSDLLDMDLDFPRMTSSISKSPRPAPIAVDKPGAQEQSRFFPEEYVPQPSAPKAAKFFGREEKIATLISVVVGIPVGVAIGFMTHYWGGW